MTTSSALLDADLSSLHTSYVRAINSAIDAGDDDSVPALAADHDRERAALVAAHEGRTHQRPGWFRRR